MPRQSIKVECPCERCGTIRYLAPSQVKAGQGRYCSRVCQFAPRPLLPHPTDPDALIVPLTQGKYAVIDRADSEAVGSFNWAAVWSGIRWYARRADKETKRHIYLHRWLIDAPADLEVDHEDRDGLNCRRCNIRHATSSENLSNRGIQRNNSTGYKGVSRPPKHNRFLAVIRFERKVYRLGWFDTAEEAAHAYDAKARELHGKFARLNFPD